VIAFYNPVSKRRRTQLAHAKEVLLQHRPKDTPVILATNLGREGEYVRFVELETLNVDDVDMLTVVVVGSSESRKMQQLGGKEWVYTPRGYSDKSTTEMIKN
jgi:cobalt-precorrin 5A hydrolase/precorrin-3B C17-methyltransferase